jgi:hypothetical protein
MWRLASRSNILVVYNVLVVGATVDCKSLICHEPKLDTRAQGWHLVGPESSHLRREEYFVSPQKTGYSKQIELELRRNANVCFIGGNRCNTLKNQQ